MAEVEASTLLCLSLDLSHLSPYPLAPLGGALLKAPMSSHISWRSLHPLIHLCVSGPVLKSFCMRTEFGLDILKAHGWTLVLGV